MKLSKFQVSRTPVRNRENVKLDASGEGDGVDENLNIGLLLGESRGGCYNSQQHGCSQYGFTRCPGSYQSFCAGFQEVS